MNEFCCECIYVDMKGTYSCLNIDIRTKHADVIYGIPKYVICSRVRYTNSAICKNSRAIKCKYFEENVLK